MVPAHMQALIGLSVYVHGSALSHTALLCGSLSTSSLMDALLATPSGTQKITALALGVWASPLTLISPATYKGQGKQEPPAHITGIITEH